MTNYGCFLWFLSLGWVSSLLPSAPTTIYGTLAQTSARWLTCTNIQSTQNSIFQTMWQKILLIINSMHIVRDLTHQKVNSIVEGEFDRIRSKCTLGLHLTMYSICIWWVQKFRDEFVWYNRVYLNDLLWKVKMFLLQFATRNLLVFPYYSFLAMAAVTVKSDHWALCLSANQRMSSSRFGSTISPLISTRNWVDSSEHCSKNKPNL